MLVMWFLCLFYRLLDSREGNAACHNASLPDISNDALAAFDWVTAHAERYGGGGKPVVFGQSAGAHLALTASVRRASEVAAGIAYYGPSDFTDFAQRALDGSYTDQQGLDILTRVLGAPVTEVDLNASLVTSNSFPATIEENPDAYPPMFLLHGLADTLVEARQSVRMCNALSGSVDDGPVTEAYLAGH